MLSNNDKTIRTQITLTADLKKLIEQKAGVKGQSLSEYLRRAALVTLYLEENEQNELKQLAHIVIGSIDSAKHLEWKTPKKVTAWVKKIRKEWR
ncbi:hypothetical protein A3H78_02485 [Candidatus Roizmanbacteria bacterium RIFCSPLOWO2_02_FULL_36_11]|uniref:Uncharacterized protein n=1 Tax=Candidatus Roizmanbacteria bacterium RIFCSPLOWO2_02_FULL_36_11 TaxID=1802071 RepID=A0A1F7JBG9_9BACT|nr:MAG: hypothetical protein A3H78_02485 [Candidatus Roizmanbacteria bacterium RIFCSPLOWO2_02_FULL_36_11]